MGDERKLRDLIGKAKEEYSVGDYLKAYGKRRVHRITHPIESLKEPVFRGLPGYPNRKTKAEHEAELERLRKSDRSKPPVDERPVEPLEIKRYGTIEASEGD